jgi:hypothetical protein
MRLAEMLRRSCNSPEKIEGSPIHRFPNDMCTLTSGGMWRQVLCFQPRRSAGGDRGRCRDRQVRDLRFRFG